MKQKGFTLIEILVAATLGALVLTVVFVSFITGQKIYRRAVLNAELSQNGRIALDRMGREIRQTGQVTTQLEIDKPDPPQTEIQFEDGHTDTIQYIRYYLSGTELKREVGHFYFNGDPDVWVYYNAKDNLGNSALYYQDLDQTIAQHVSYINFYKEASISIELTVSRDGKTVEFITKDTGRNL